MNPNVLHNTLNLMLESLEEAVHYAEQLEELLDSNDLPIGESGIEESEA